MRTLQKMLKVMYVSFSCLSFFLLSKPFFTGTSFKTLASGIEVYRESDKLFLCYVLNTDLFQ